MVKAFASRAEDPGFESGWRRDFTGSSHTGDLNIGTPVATLPDAWRSRVSAVTGEVESSICSFSMTGISRLNCLSRSVPEIH